MGILDGLFTGTQRFLQERGLVSSPKVSVMQFDLSGNLAVVNSVRASLIDDAVGRHIVVTVKNTSFTGLDLEVSFCGATAPDGTPLEDGVLPVGDERRFVLARKGFMMVCIMDILGKVAARQGYTPPIG